MAKTEAKVGEADHHLGATFVKGSHYLKVIHYQKLLWVEIKFLSDNILMTLNCIVIIEV